MSLGAREVLLVIRASDQASSVLRKLSVNMSSMDKDAMAAAKAQMAKGTAIMGIGAAIAGVGAMGVKFFNDSVTAAQSYEQAARLAFTQVDNGKTSLQDLMKMGLDVGKKVPVALEDTQKALYDIFSTMDVSTAQSKVLLTEFSKAAVGGQTDVSTAAVGTMRVMNAFKMGVNDVSKANDIMFQLVRKGVGTYENFNAALGKVSPSAVRAGQDLQTTAGMLAFLTRNGLSASMAATSAARSLDAVSNPKFQTNMKAMGMTVLDAQGNFKPMLQIVDELQTKFAGMTQPEKAKALTNLFKGAGNNVQAMRFFNLALNDTNHTFNTMVGDMQKSGGAMQNAYNIMLKSPQEQAKLLQNKMQALRIEIGEKLLPVKVKLMQVLTKLLDLWNKLPGPVKNAIIIFGAVVSVLMVLAGIVIMVGGAIMILDGALAIMGTSLAAVFLPITLIVTAIIAIGVAIWAVIKYHKQIGEFAKRIWGDIWNFIKRIWDDIVKFAERLWHDVSGFFERLWNDIVDGVTNAFYAVVSWFEKLPGRILDFITSIPNKLAYGLGYLIGTIAKFMLEMRRAVIEGGIAVIEWFQKLPERVLAFLISAGKWLVKTGNDILTGLINGIVSGYEAVKNWFQALPGRILNFMVGAAVWLLRTGIDILHGLNSGVTNGSNAVIDWFKALPGNVLKWIGNAAGWLLHVGEDVVNGLLNGLKSAWHAVTNWVSNIGQSFLGGIKDALGIHSPSKKMHEIGGFLMQGLANGIRDSADIALKAATDAANGVSGAFSGNLNGSFSSYAAGQVGSPSVTTGLAGAMARTSGGGGTTVPISIYTQEINPLQHAAELGMLISTRV